MTLWLPVPTLHYQGVQGYWDSRYKPSHNPRADSKAWGEPSLGQGPLSSGWLTLESLGTLTHLCLCLFSSDPKRSPSPPPPPQSLNDEWIYRTSEIEG